jgi:xanthine dehydrogenase accessory factor
MRSELPQLITLARRLLDNRERGTLATLFAADGSSYRSLGSIMVGGPPGFVAGGVSGGCLEDYIVRHGRELTRDPAAVLLSFDTGSADDAEDAKPVLGCGGSIQVLVERLTAGQLDHLLRLAEAYDADVPSLTTCTIDAAGGHPAGVTVSRSWGRCGMGDATAGLGRDALCDRRSYSGPVSATRQALVHYVPALTRLIIFGAGDDVRPVCDLGRSLGGT